MSIQADATMSEPGLARLVAKVRSWASARWFTLTLIAIAAPLLLINLAGSYPPIDEANTMMLARNVLRYGYPLMWDGEYLIPPFFDGDMTADGVWISHPWLQFYVAAASFAVLGFNTLAARLPFALAGLLSVVAIYHLARRMSGSEPLARLTAILLVLHPGFLVYSRQSRYYSLTFLFGILTLLTFLQWLDRPSKRNLLFLVLASALLFHTYYPFWVFVSLTIGLYFVLIARRWRLLPAFLAGAVLIGLLTIPWLAYAQPHAPVDTGPQLEAWTKNYLVYAWKLNLWIAPVYTLAAILGFLVLLRWTRIIRKQEPDGLAAPKSYLLFLSVLFYTAFVSLIPILTTQYAMPAIPYLTILAAFLVWKIREYNRWLAAVVLVLLVVTNLWNVLPYVVVEKSGIPPQAAEAVIPNADCDFVTGPSLEHYLKDELVIKSYFVDFLASLFRDYDNRMEGIITTLSQYGTEDQTVLGFWGEANAIRFYTDMKVVYHFFPLFQNPEVKALVYRPGTRIDWIVPDALNFYPAPDPFFTFDIDDYERVKVPYPKEFFGNDPNLDGFQFATDRGVLQSFYLLRRKDLAR